MCAGKTLTGVLCNLFNMLCNIGNTNNVSIVLVGLWQTAVELKVSGKSQELIVSWSVLRQFSDSVQEYVVQHKPIGLPDTRCLNWVKVPKKQTSVTLRGRFLYMSGQFV